MESEGNSFLPRILSVFYAIFHDNKGTDIIYQVPENLIATSHTISGLNNSTSPAVRSLSSETPSPHAANKSGSSGRVRPSRASSSSLNSLLANSRETLSSSQKRSSSTHNILFKFEDISKYVIPPSALCGRLVMCATRRHRIIGFPVELYNQRYERNYFRYNVCFVFERTADLSCYEPIVRKIGRVLTTCEEESCFLSSPDTSHSIHAILEQLYEDLNSYSETSILIDRFNSIELKIFPFYPNPPEVNDWVVPIALINLKKRIEENWDLTMAKVCNFIDGTNHVSRIAYLADCDLDLTRKAIQHLLYYQVIMMIDIFQFNNMYTLCRSVEWLADEAHVRDECGPYVTRSDREISEWPELLHLYSRLKPGITVFQWMQEYDTHKHGIDPRRFVSFGVIKGFLRRVHRWPVLLPAPPQEKDRRATSMSIGRRRGKSLSMPSAPAVTANSSGATTPTLADVAVNLNGFTFARNLDGSSAATATNGLTRHLSHGDELTMTSPTRRASAAEKYLEQFRREIDGTPGMNPTTSSPHTQRFSRAYQGPLSSGAGDAIPRRHSVAQPPASSAAANLHSSMSGLHLSAGASSTAVTTDGGDTSTSGVSTPTRPRLSRSPSSQTAAAAFAHGAYPSAGVLVNVPNGLKELLDGTRHTDELGVRFEVGWPVLEKFLVTIGGGKGDGDFGRVEIIYR